MDTITLKEAIIKAVAISDKGDYQTAYVTLLNAVKEFTALTQSEINEAVINQDMD